MTYLQVSSPEAKPTTNHLDHFPLGANNFSPLENDGAKENDDNELAVRSTRLELTFPTKPIPGLKSVNILLKVDASAGCGGHAWPAGKTLSNYLTRAGSNFVEDKTVLELGSGSGLVGIVAAKLGARVLITDQTWVNTKRSDSHLDLNERGSPMLPLMKENVSLNNLNSTVMVKELKWYDIDDAPKIVDLIHSIREEAIPPSISKPDLLLAADCVYLESAFAPLVQTLLHLVGPQTETLFCYAKRRKADKRFFAILKKRFTWEEVSTDTDRPEDAREPIYLYRLSRKRQSEEIVKSS